MAKGWRVGTVTEFLGLSPEEATRIEIRVAVSRTPSRVRSSGRAWRPARSPTRFDTGSVEEDRLAGGGGTVGGEGDIEGAEAVFAGGKGAGLLA